MKVAIFTDTYLPYINGVVTHINTLQKQLVKNGHEVLIVTASPKYSKHTIKNNVLYCPSVTVKKLYGYGAANPINLKRLKILKDFNPDVLHIHTEFTIGYFAMFVARKLKKPIVYTLHTMYDDYLFYVAPKRMVKTVKPAAHFYLKKVANKATEIIGPSLKVVEFLKSIKVNKPINLINNTGDFSNFFPQNQDFDKISSLKKELGITPNDTTLCFVGRLGKEKSIDVLINYFTEQFKENKNVKLFIIGDGPERENLILLINSLKMKDQIKLLGKIPHDTIPTYFNSFNLYTSASLSEIHSISTLEAMASGLYVLQRLDELNRGQIIEGVNGNIFNSSIEFAFYINEYIKLTQSERILKSDKVVESTKQYGEKEFGEAVIEVYKSAIKKATK